MLRGLCISPLFIQQHHEPSERNGKSMNKKSRRNWTFALFTVPGFLLYSFFFITPVILGIYYSMTDWNGISRDFDFIALDNYKKIFQTSQFIDSLSFTLKYTILLVVFVIFFGIIIALLLNRKIKGRSFFRAIYFIPAVLSLLTVGLIFNQICYYIIPEIGKTLHIEILSQNPLADKNLAMWTILFVNLWQGLAIPTLLFLAGLQGVPIDLYEVATLDGATSWEKFRYITLPFILPVVSVVFVLTFKSGLMVFDYIIAMTEGGPGNATKSVAMLIYQHGFTQNKYSYSIAEAIIVGIIIAAISGIQIFLTNKKKAV